MIKFAQKPAKHSGFTLIELMIVVVIVGILAAVAYPSYLNIIRKSHRSDGIALLQAAQLGQEKFRINSATYADTGDLSNNAFARVCVFSGGSCLSQNGYYSLTSTDNDASGYTLTATALGDQANDTDCPTISLTQSATDITYTPSTCWGK